MNYIVETQRGYYDEYGNEMGNYWFPENHYKRLKGAMKVYQKYVGKFGWVTRIIDFEGNEVVSSVPVERVSV